MIDYISRYKVIVFDLGGTLMEYSGMPLNWSEYYFKGFKTVSENHNLFLSDNEIQISSEILKAFNPRHTGRENEIAPEVLFEQAKDQADWESFNNIFKFTVGTAADVMKLAMVRLQNDFIKNNIKSKIIIQVHDELVIETVNTELYEVKSLVKKAMELDQPFLVPLKIDIYAGQSWMEI